MTDREADECIDELRNELEILRKKAKQELTTLRTRILDNLPTRG